MIYVVDTSSFIEISDSLSRKRLHGVLKRLEQLVIAGDVTYPEQVSSELNDYGRKDAISVLCDAVKRARIYPEPDYATVKRILKNETVRKLCRWAESTKEEADPWVVAQALELEEDGLTATIVTDDYKDKPDGAGGIKKSSINSAAAEFDIPCIRAKEFLQSVVLDQS